MSGTIRYGEDGALDPEDSATPVPEDEQAPGYHEGEQPPLEATAMSGTVETSGTSGTAQDAADAAPQVFEQADEVNAQTPEGIAQAPEADPEATGEDSLEPDYSGVQGTEPGAGQEEADGKFDPSEHGVDDVRDYLDGCDEAERDRVLAAEREGKARKGILGD